MTKTSAARVYRGTPRNLRFLAQQLRRGELVAVPTETVYGLAANAFDAEACAKIFRAKGRPATDPLIVHIHDLAQLSELGVVNDAALKLADTFWPGPLTMVLPKKPVVADAITAGRPSVAIRMPQHRLLRQLLRLSGVPLAAPSANPFGYVSPTTARHVRDNLGTKIAYILDGGPAAIGLESTIVDLRNPRAPQLLRPGAITRDALEQVLGIPVAALKRSSDSHAKSGQLSPGRMKRHYSPKTSVVLHDSLADFPRRDEAYVCIRRPAGRLPKNVFWLDSRGNLRAAASRLFAMLRELDAMGFRRIHVERARGEGMAEAINDRLRRASAY
ncbi:MAG: L-threonylcarbamoyladenylate synthase [Opitutaceae bacterium]|nr:L-threonylcarbamoyladenylate synthase [Opitutaceae bacterium]